MTFTEHLDDWLHFHQDEFQKLAIEEPDENAWWARLMNTLQIDNRPAIKAIQSVFKYAGAPENDIIKAYNHFKAL